MTVSDDVELLSLPEVARRLGVSRAVVKGIVLGGSLPAVRTVDRWYVRREDLTAFADRFEAPKKRTKASRPPRRNEETRAAIAALIGEWQEATANELAVAVGIHPGNVRKHLVMLEAAGVAKRDDEGLWRLTQAGDRYQEARARSA